MDEIIIIVPAYNEEQNIKKVLIEIKKYDKNLDIVVINDCSIDNTGIVVSDFMKNYNNVFLINHQKNQGGGKAVQSGIKFALSRGYNYAIQMDGDGQHNIHDLYKIKNALEYENYDLVIGSRFLQRSGYKTSLIRYLGIMFFSFFASFLTRQKITDITSGFKGMNKNVMILFSRDYSSRHPAFEAAIKVKKNGYKIKEVPVTMKKRVYGQSEFNWKRMILFPIKMIISLIKIYFIS
jgi:glycosyltransferase involved in cell wall biosynthesis